MKKSRWLWNVDGVPHKGWTNVGFSDLGPDDKTQCEMCGRRIRYVHAMSHDDYDNNVDAGCCCADKMSVGYDGKERDKQFKERQKWPGKQWQWSKKDEPYVILGNFVVGLYSRGEKWGWYWLHRQDKSQGQRSSPIYSSFDEARLALHDAFCIERFPWRRKTEN